MTESANTEHVFAQSGDLQKLYISLWILNRISAIETVKPVKSYFTPDMANVQGVLLVVYELSAYCAMLIAKHVACSAEYVEQSINVVESFCDGTIKIENYHDLDPIELVGQLSLHCQPTKQKKDSNNA